MSSLEIPLVVEFAPGSRLRQEAQAPEAAQPSPELRSGPPDSFVVLPDGHEVALPSDQIVLFEHRNGRGRVGFGGMSFEGVHEDRLVFWRVRDVLPEELTGGCDRILLDPGIVARVIVQGNQVWPRAG